MFPNLDNMKDIKAPKIALDNRKVKRPSTEGIIDGLGIFLCNSSFRQIHFKQMTLQPGPEISAPIMILKFTESINW